MTTQVPDYIVTPWTGGEVLHCCPPIYGPQAIWTPRFVSNTTACQRGYTARWRIKDDRLYLDDAGGNVEPEEFPPGAKGLLPHWALRALKKPAIPKKFYSRKAVACDLSDFYGHPGPIHADWITMELRIPEDGQTTRYMYGNYLCVEVEKGVVARDPVRKDVQPDIPDIFGRKTS